MLSSLLHFLMGTTGDIYSWRTCCPMPGDTVCFDNIMDKSDCQQNHVITEQFFYCRRREPTPPEVRLQREKEKELAELERATRTVFAYNLNIKAEERDIFEFFSKVCLGGTNHAAASLTEEHAALAYLSVSSVCALPSSLMA